MHLTDAGEIVDFYRHPEAVEDGLNVVFAHVAQHHHEFLATETKEFVVAAEALAHQVGDAQQHLVTEKVTVVVVDLLEVVDVRDGKPARLGDGGTEGAAFVRLLAGLLGQLCGGDQAFEVVVEGLAVEEPGEGVEVGIFPGLVLVFEAAQEEGKGLAIRGAGLEGAMDFQHPAGFAQGANGKGEAPGVALVGDRVAVVGVQAVGQERVHREPGLAIADVVPIGVGAVGHAAAEQADGEVGGREAHGEHQAEAAIEEVHGGFGGYPEDLAQVAGA